MSSTDERFSRGVLRRAWQLFRAPPLELALAAATVLIFCAVVLGILGGPSGIGLMRLITCW